MCGAKIAGFSIKVQTLLPREKSPQLVNEWGVGLLNYMTILHKSPHVGHGAACLGNGMLFPGQVYAASVPHHNQVFQLDLGL